MIKHQLTYSDRRIILDTFNSLKTSSDKTDNEIIESSSEWAKRIKPRFGFEYSLTRNVIILTRYLADQKSSHDIIEIARGALLFILKEEIKEKGNITKYVLRANKKGDELHDYQKARMYIGFLEISMEDK